MQTEEQRLAELYEQWGRLTDQEGQAIGLGDWPRVAGHQAEKRRLTETIVDAERAWQKAAQLRGLAPPALPARCRAMVHELIAQERRNIEALQARRQAMEAEQRDLESSGRQLRQLYQAYRPATSPLWQSYS